MNELMYFVNFELLFTTLIKIFFAGGAADSENLIYFPMETGFKVHKFTGDKNTCKKHYKTYKIITKKNESMNIHEYILGVIAFLYRWLA